MDKKSKELAAVGGIIFGIGLATGTGIVAQQDYQEARSIEETAPDNAESLRRIADIAYGIDLGGVALAAASGFALRRFENQADSVVA